MLSQVAGIGPAEPTADSWDSVFESSDVDRSRAHMSGMLCRHRLDHCRGGQMPFFRHRHADFASLDIHQLEYAMFGGDARVNVPELSDIFLVEINLAGRSTIHGDGEALPFDGGQICVINAGQPHRKHWQTDGRQVFVRIARERIDRVLADLIDDVPTSPLLFDRRPVPVTGDGASVMHVIRLMLAELSLPASARAGRRSADSAERLFLETMLETLPNNYRSRLAAPTQAAIPAAVPGMVHRTIDHLHRHAGEAVSMAELAQIAGTSVRTLQRAFRNAIGTSPMTYLKNLRLDRCHAALAAGGGRRVTDVALENGFGHLGKFAGDYRDRFGETPSETLQRARNGGGAG